MKTKKKITVVVKPKKAKRATVTKTEITRLGKALRGLGGLAGATLGNFVGQGAIGSAVGTNLGASLSRWLGSGAYSVRSNSLVAAASRETSNGIPSMHRTSTSIVVTHKEYLGEILGNTTFSVQNSFPLNPGLALTFPWLSGLAHQFQEYRIRGLIFHYVPTSGHAIASTNAALGTVMLQTSYRASDSAPASKVEMLNEFWASEGSPSESFVHPVECDPKQNPFSTLYVRTGSVPTGDTLLMYDLGVTHVAVSGQQASGNVLGDLWVSYDIELSKPVAASNTTVDIISATGAFTSPVVANLFSSGTQTIKGWPFTASTNTITLPKGTVGTFALLLQVIPSSTFSMWNSGGGALAVTYTNATAYTGGPTGTGVMNQSLAAGATFANGAYQVDYFTVADPLKQAIITYASGSWTGTASAANIVLSQLA